VSGIRSSYKQDDGIEEIS